MMRKALLCTMLAGSAAALAQPAGTPPEPHALCAALSQAAPPRGAAPAPGAGRAESDRLLAQAAAQMAAPSRRAATEALALLEQATATDPGHALAFARLAVAHVDAWRFGAEPLQAAAARRWQALTTAFALDPDHVFVLTQLANAIAGKARDMDCAERVLLRARQIAPRDPDVSFGLAIVRGSKGEFQVAYADEAAAFEAAEPAKRLALQYNAGRLHFMAHDYRWVLAHYAALIQANPEHRLNGLAYFFRSLALAAQGDPQQALAEVMRKPPGPDGDAGALANLARLQILAGERAAGEANLQRLLDRDARGELVVAYQIAAVYEALGQREEVFRWLARHNEEMVGLSGWLPWITHDPRWASVRGDPQFAALLAASRPVR